MLVKMWRDEQIPVVWKMNYGTPEYFTRCYWQKQEKVLPIWLCYRLALFLYFLTTTLYTILDPDIPSEDKPKYMIFLTNWNYLLQLIQFGLAFGITAKRYTLEIKNPAILPMEKTPISYKIYWILYCIVLPVSVAICILFWCLVYDPVLFPINAHNLMVHCFNGVIMILDFILIAFPIRLSHIIFVDFFSLFYLVFTVIYYYSGGTGTKGLRNIYKVLDWEKPLGALSICGVGFLVIDFLFAFFWIFSLVKENVRSANL